MTVTSMLTMSPALSFLSPGMPWQTTWFTDVQIDAGIRLVARAARS